ncbi:cysteine--tRNA ligase [Candidatus Giovannonibacteria bacterium]|nr:cysteine--tRNA ligase [Candidatus Giovannonibacteria bacterium]
MSMEFWNTLTKKKETFKPITKNQAGIYTCGPTVYDRAHIGNLRSYVFSDTLRRTLEYAGFKVKQIVNITDIGHLTSDADSGDDKMVKGLKREGLPLSLAGLKQLADKYEKLFKEDLEKLNIETADAFPRATEYLPDEIALVEELEKKGFAYGLPDGIYFNTGKLDGYGKLGGLTPAGEGRARVESGEKKNPRDFVLWKLSQDEHLGFESKWGRGFPGWHIECSAMSRKLLGQPFDIHTGGIDHIPVHHNNEIAQSEAAYGTPLANYWLHNEFLTLSDSKMAKSDGNIITLGALEEKGFSPLAYRYFLLLSHYRTQTSFSWEALKAAETAYRRIKEAIADITESGGEISEIYKKEFKEAIENDLNTPEALAVVWKLIKDEKLPPKDIRTTILDFDRILGLKLDLNEFAIVEISEEVKKLIEQREKAREEKNWEEADRLRREIEKNGYFVEDSTRGPVLKMLK